MFSSDNWIRALFLAYYLTGLNMVLYHSASAPMDRPGYVYLGFWRKLLAGAIWPYIARMNRELGWFLVTYIASVIVATAFFALAGIFLEHGFWRTLIVTVVCTTPIGVMPLAIVSSLLWLLLRRPLGLEVPGAVERTQKLRELGLQYDPPAKYEPPFPGSTRGAVPFSSGKSHPVEIQDLLSRIEEFARAMPDSLRGVSDPVLGSLRKTITSKWNDADAAEYVNVAREGHSAESFICNHLVHTMADELESGSHHIYRGVLSGEGNQYRAVFEHAIRTMVERGQYTQEWADEKLRKPVYESMKRVG